MPVIPPPDWNLVVSLASSAFMAVSLTLVFVFARHEVRVSRLKTLVQFERTFTVKDTTAPSFEYVREKYLEDIDLEDIDQDRKLRDGKNIRDLTEVEAHDLLPRLRKLNWINLRSTGVLIWTSRSAGDVLVLTNGTPAGVVQRLSCSGAHPSPDAESEARFTPH